MNKTEKNKNKIILEEIKENFIDFCEFYFKDDSLVQDFISDIRYFEDKIDTEKSVNEIKKFIKEFNKEV